jgi:hypothetical protein
VADDVISGTREIFWAIELKTTTAPLLVLVFLLPLSRLYAYPIAFLPTMNHRVADSLFYFGKYE